MSPPRELMMYHIIYDALLGILHIVFHPSCATDAPQ